MNIKRKRKNCKKIGRKYLIRIIYYLMHVWIRKGSINHLVEWTANQFIEIIITSYNITNFRIFINWVLYYLIYVIKNCFLNDLAMFLFLKRWRCNINWKQFYRWYDDKCNSRGYNKKPNNKIQNYYHFKLLSILNVLWLQKSGIILFVTIKILSSEKNYFTYLISVQT